MSKLIKNDLELPQFIEAQVQRRQGPILGGKDDILKIIMSQIQGFQAFQLPQSLNFSLFLIENNQNLDGDPLNLAEVHPEREKSAITAWEVVNPPEGVIPQIEGDHIVE